MRRFFLVSAILPFVCAASYAQSGRHKDPAGKSPPPPPVEIPSPEPSTPPKTLVPREIEGERIYISKELDEKPVILKKPEARYTRQGQRHQTRGIVLLRVVLAADAIVKHIEVVKGLPDGLSEKAIEAARQIKFKPGMKDGKPVSMWVELEYHFDIY